MADAPLRNQATIYVPSTVGSKSIGTTRHKKRVNNVRKWFNNRYGGSTSVQGRGSWTGKNRRTVTEDVVKVSSYTNRKIDRRAKVFKQARIWGRKWKQESISLEYNDRLYILTTNGGK
jgi:hypothetical protein